MAELTPVVTESFVQYAGSVLQSRALIDVRDCLKPSARQIFYCLYTDKFTNDKPYKKVLKMIGSVARIYIHGDSSAEGIIMRAGQPFAFRYPLVDGKGNFGTIQKSGNWAAPRYPDARLAKLQDSMFADLDKDTIEEWRDNYDDTEQYPTVLPTKGFYNIVNGSFGIGIGMGSSIPQFNIVEVNEALVKLLQNPNIDFNEIYCAPDFATGAILLNDAEVRQSMKDGWGKACKLRSVVEYDTGERCLIVKEIPFGVYTNTICEELEGILNGEENPGIDRFNDLSGATPLIKIYLTRASNPDKVLRYLYKNTSLQYHYSINMTMLDNGRFPKVFTWKEALQAHIDHEKVVYRRGYEFDLNKINARLHILEGLLIAMANIDEVVHTIRNAASSVTAKKDLMEKFLLDEVQTKAILDMKLSRLAHLEVQKLENEKTSLETEKARIEGILGNEELFNNELIKGWRETAKKFGDARRTKILDVEGEDDEPAEIRSLQLSLTNKNNVFVAESSSLYTQRRGSVGAKMKLDANEYVVSTRAIESNEMVIFFSKTGNFYSCAASTIPVGEKTSVFNLFSIRDSEQICALTSIKKKSETKHILFFTKNGYCKKSELSEYNIKRSGGVRALVLDEGDEICNVVFTDSDNVGILTERGNFLVIKTSDIRPIGRTSKGIHAIKLNEDDYVVSARIIPKQTTSIVSVSGNGLIKKMPANEFMPQTKNTKGSKIQKLNDGDWLADFYPLTTEKEILVASTHSCLKISVNDVPEFSKGALGNKSIKLADKANVVSLSNS